MKISKEGFKITTGTDGIDKLLFDSIRANECIEFAIKQNIKRIALNPSNGYTENNLVPILPLKDFIEGLIIGSEKIRTEKLHLFRHLNYLGLPDNKLDELDVSNLPDLHTLACEYTERIKGLEFCNKLKNLTISNYRTQSGNLISFPCLLFLEQLSLIKTDIVSLDGIEQLKHLRKIEIFIAPKLHSLNRLIFFSDQLEEIQLEQCKKINGYEILGNLYTLKKITLTDSGSLKSLSFLKSLPHIKFISFWGTNVLDGNMDYCAGIKYVGFDNKKHYNHKVDFFRK